MNIFTKPFRNFSLHSAILLLVLLGSGMSSSPETPTDWPITLFWYCSAQGESGRIYEGVSNTKRSSMRQAKDACEYSQEKKCVVINCFRAT